MQFKVPQNVRREDKIVGPLTLKQMIICAIGGTIAYAIYISLAKFYLWITWLPPMAIVVMITIAFAFVRPLDMSFIKWILLWAEFALLPKKRLWVKSSGEIIPPQITTTAKKDKDKLKDAADAMEEKQKKLEELNKFLESQKNNIKKT